MHTARRLRSKPVRIDVTSLLSDLSIESSHGSPSFGAVTGFGAETNRVAEDVNQLGHSEDPVQGMNQTDIILWPEIICATPSVTRTLFGAFEHEFLHELNHKLLEGLARATMRHKIKVTSHDAGWLRQRLSTVRGPSFVVRVFIADHGIRATLSPATLKIWSGKNEPPDEVQEIIDTYENWPCIPQDLQLATKEVTESEGKLVLHRHYGQYVACERGDPSCRTEDWSNRRVSGTQKILSFC